MPAAPSEARRTPAADRPLMALVLLALVVRLGLLIWARGRGLVIENEGAEFARTAQNLVSGHGYVGMFANGPQLNFSPLYPVLIGGLSLVVGGAELAARLISLVAGALLVLPMFALAQRMYGRGAALTVGALVACHPVLVVLSVSTFSEGLYLTLVMSSLYWLVRWMEERRMGLAATAGAFVGLAYLTRPEAFLLAGVALACGAGWWLLRREGPVLLQTAAFGAVFAAFALPFIVFLTVETGQVRIEAKGALVKAWGERMNSGMGYWQAATEVSDDLEPVGVFVRSNQDVIRSRRGRPGGMVSYLAQAAPRNVPLLTRTLVRGRLYGSPALLALAIIGLVRSALDRSRLVYGAIVAVAVAIMFTALLASARLDARYLLAPLGPLLLWSAGGIEAIAAWTRKTLARLAPANVARAAGALAFGAAFLAPVALSARAVPDDTEVGGAFLTERADAGRWLAAHAVEHPRVMGTSLVPAWYGGSSWFGYLPYTRSDVALRYVAQQRPDYIVMLENHTPDLPYLASWFASGIPDGRAELVHEEGRPPRERVRIYRWHTANLQ